MTGPTILFSTKLIPFFSDLI